MNLAREQFGLMQRLRTIAADVRTPGRAVGESIQPFIDRWKNPDVPRKGAGDAIVAYAIDAAAVANRIESIGRDLRQQRVCGWPFHRGFQRRLVAVAENFECHGFMECHAGYEGQTDQLHEGRIDVVWSQRRVPVAIFEIDRTVKPGSFWKLKEAEVPYKFWVYFGKDFWAMDRFMRKNDPSREITLVKIRHGFVPRFA
jgi:hypothetical protein